MRSEGTFLLQSCLVVLNAQAELQMIFQKCVKNQRQGQDVLM